MATHYITDNNKTNQRPIDLSRRGPLTFSFSHIFTTVLKIKRNNQHSTGTSCMYYGLTWETQQLQPQDMFYVWIEI